MLYEGQGTRLKRYRLLRLMDWMSTNDSDLSEWADRPRPDDARWRDHGVPVEVMVELVPAGAEGARGVLERGLERHVRPARHASEQGLAAGLSANGYEAQLVFYSRRAVQLGALEWVSQPREESPKYDALQRFIGTTPRWW